VASSAHRSKFLPDGLEAELVPGQLLKKRPMLQVARQAYRALKMSGIGERVPVVDVE
jgi:hypothetical protein